MKSAKIKFGKWILDQKKILTSMEEKMNWEEKATFRSMEVLAAVGLTMSVLAILQSITIVIYNITLL